MDASMIADWPARCILMKRGIKSSLIAIQLELDWKGHSETAKIGRHYCEQRSPLKTACYIWTGDGVTVTDVKRKSSDSVGYISCARMLREAL
uniref:AlNc14C224G9169 protein n=1 Tax=Albugo laibachii Nc14 TaxID=890382 RepID=F0WS28_9STRA|nr:AlNc14C224G9169 [Albugo laibachii Nc14]|eukprot:CCA24146.1 AlNc14C224G9169 [Albugo laibachii Nc14]